MAFDEMLSLLFTAMAVACVAVFFWTLLRVLRENFRTHGLAGGEPAHSITIARRGVGLRE